MNGFSRVFFAMLGSLLRLVAWPPFTAADRLHEAAAWCDRRAAQETRS